MKTGDWGKVTLECSDFFKTYDGAFGLVWNLSKLITCLYHSLSFCFRGSMYYCREIIFSVLGSKPNLNFCICEYLGVASCDVELLFLADSLCCSTWPMDWPCVTAFMLCNNNVSGYWKLKIPSEIQIEWRKRKEMSVD